MNKLQSSSASRSAQTQHGFVLIVCLLMLVVMSLLAVSVFRGANTQERIAGNTREKQRALQAAESAINYAELWLRDASLGTGTGITCPTDTVDGNDLANMRICANVLVDPTKVPWASAIKYLPPKMTVAANGGVTSSGNVNYAKEPSFYIQYMGTSTTASRLYRITAVGYGGDIATVAVIESVFEMPTGGGAGLSGL